MNSGLARSPARHAAYRLERALAEAARARNDLDAAMRYLERAHILAQPWPGAHSWTHWAMLVVAVERGDGREFAGQMLRLSVGWIGSLIGRLPAGNPGSTRVGATTPADPPADLAPLLD